MIGQHPFTDKTIRAKWKHHAAYILFSWQIFDGMDARFGSGVVAKIVGYLASAYHGLSELEILDLLSCNNDVLLLVYPRDIPTIMRFPIIVWHDILSHLGMFIN